MESVEEKITCGRDHSRLEGIPGGAETSSAVPIVEKVVCAIIRAILSGRRKLSCFNKFFSKPGKSEKKIKITTKSKQMKRALLDSTVSIRKSSQYFCCLNLIHELLHGEGSISSLRQVYYSNVDVFKNQAESNGCIAKLTHAFQCTRESLRIFTSAKGLIRGSLQFAEGTGDSKEWIDCMNYFEKRGHAIPAFEVNELILDPKTKFILVVEKETLFNRLLDSNFIERCGPCIILTSRGYPDLPSRAFLKKLHEEWKKDDAIFYLSDYDPHGINIGLTYALPSLKGAYYQPDNSVRIMRLIEFPVCEKAVHNGDLVSLDDLRSLTSKDLKLLSSMTQKLTGSGVGLRFKSVDKSWGNVIRLMKKSGLKYEADSLVNLEKHILDCISSSRVSLS